MTTALRQQKFSNDDFSDCHFYPWVGPQYTDGAIDGLRVLVLGESHYAFGLPVERERGLTRLVIQEELDGKRRHRFITGVMQALFGRDAVRDRARVVTMWNAMAFYNYVQEYVGDASRKRPSKAAWLRSAAPLRSVLSTLQPDFVLACGRALYEHLKLVDGLTDDGEFGKDGDKRTRSRLIDLGEGRRGVVGMIYHPSWSGFSAPEWRPRVREYLERANQVKKEQRAG